MPAKMNLSLRVLLAGLLLWAGFFELLRYSNEWHLKQAGALLTPVLLGQTKGADAVSKTQAAVQLTNQMRSQAPLDSRAVLIEGTGLILLGQGQQADALFRQQLRVDERPELLINLGRARASLGDEAGARRNFLRAAWSSDNAIETLPQSMRAELRAEVKARELELAEGNTNAIPAF